MNNPLYFIVFIISALSLCSCASIQGFPERVVNTDEELEQLKIYFEQGKVDDYNSSRTDNDRMRIRNEIINGRITAIDLQFYLFQQRLHEEGVNLNIGTDVITLGLGAGGAFASGGTSQILSAVSGAITGIKGSIDKNAFFEQTMPALFAQMIAKRKAVLVTIRWGLANSPTDYPLQQGFADLEDYRYAGTIPGAIAGIVESAGATSANATEQLQTILPFNLDSPAERIKKVIFLDPEGRRLDPDGVERMRRCWVQRGVPQETMITDFVLQPSFAVKRREVANCLDVTR